MVYGKDDDMLNLNLEQRYYYLYTALTWQNPSTNLPVTHDNAAYGLFIQNYVDFTVEGWMCEIAPYSQRGWLCESFSIPYDDFDPWSEKMPLGRVPNSWWECGCEDKNTYTQAFCR